MNDKKGWVDFKAVKAAVTIEMVLDHYGVTGLKRVGEELRGPCPIHRSSKPSKHLSVNPAKSAFKCFANTCGAHGNVLDFVAAMEICSARDAALKLVEWFGIGETQSPKPEPAENTDGNFHRGIYSNKDGNLFEMIAIALLVGGDSAEVVVYRALFDDYQYWVTEPSDFAGDESRFTLVKAL